jgi:hypothetical protein
VNPTLPKMFLVIHVKNIKAARSMQGNVGTQLTEFSILNFFNLVMLTYVPCTFSSSLHVRHQYAAPIQTRSIFHMCSLLHILKGT